MKNANQALDSLVKGVTVLITNGPWVDVPEQHHPVFGSSPAHRERNDSVNGMIIRVLATELPFVAVEIVFSQAFQTGKRFVLDFTTPGLEYRIVKPEFAEALTEPTRGSRTYPMPDGTSLTFQTDADDFEDDDDEDYEYSIQP